MRNFGRPRVPARGVAAGAVVLGLVGAGWFGWSTWTAGPSDDPKLFANRVWAERARRDDRDIVRYLVPLDLAGKRKGTVSASSRYRFAGEVFGWSRDGQKLTLTLPQERKKVVVDVRTWKCGKNEAPEGFDLCLEIGRGDRKLKLYSRKGWRVPKGEDLPVPIQDLPDPGECVDCEVAPLDDVWLVTP
jgi:hypothetical protein